MSAGFADEDIIQAGGGAEAQALVRTGEPFHIVVCDWNMPEMNGLDLLRWFRTENADVATPFYIVTGEDSDAQLAMLLNAGATGYLIKPVHPQDILDLAETLSPT
jgi:DNA-binding response OmpR family regulator